MRIAIVTTSYPRAPGDAGGHFIETEAFLLARDGHDVHVVAPGPMGSRPSSRGSLSITVWGAGGETLFGSPGAIARAKENPLRLLQLVRFLPAARRVVTALVPIDRTIAHFVVPCGYPLALAGTGNLDVVLHGSDLRLLVTLPSPIRHHIVRRLVGRGATFRFVAEALRNELLAALAPDWSELVRRASRIELPPIEVPTSAWAQPEHGERPRWVVCARLIESKRVDRAIREAARRNARLTVIGDGPLRSELEALASSVAPDTRFVGQVARNQALALIAGSHTLVHLSEAEGAPTVIREARALGVPVLATAVGDVERWAAEDPGIEIFRPS